MLEHSSDHDSNSNSENNQRSKFLTRQVVALDDNWTIKSSRNGRKFTRSSNQGEAVLLDTEPDQTSFSSPEKNISVNMVDNNDLHIFSPDELEISTQNVHSIPKTNNIQSSPIRTSTQSISRSPALTKNKQSPLKDDRKRITSSDDDDVETYNLKENDLKIKLKKEKQHGKKTGELFNKLHEDYEDLLEKYAHAENTIDQLRFQPKVFGDNTPRSTTSEHQIHFTQQSKVNLATLRSSGAYISTTGSPFSSIRPVPSSTTTTTTPIRKSISPAYSGTVESVFFDEITPERTIVQEELTTPEIFKLDLLIETKTLGDKMKSFLTLMDENQLSLAEQKQVYENIKEDYEKLIKVFNKNKYDIDHDIDLNKELETMKQLLKEIVKKITQNLLGKSVIDSSLERQTPDESRSSQLSVRSSLSNHNDLINKKDPIKSVSNELQPNSKKLKFNLTDHQQPINNKQKPYIYVSGDSDDEQQSTGIMPIPYTKSVESTSFELDYIPSTSVKHHQHKFEDQIHPSQSKRNAPRYSNSRTNVSYDNKLYTSTMDEEQESISSSSRSSGSGSESPGSPYRNKFNNQSLHRRKPSGHSDLYQSDIETHLTGSFNHPSQSSSLNKKKMHRSYHLWKPQKSSISHRTRLTPVHRSASIATTSKIKTNHRQLIPPTYRSSLYINHTNTNRNLHEQIDENLYLDPQTGIVYRYQSNKNKNLTRVYSQPSSQTKLYRCDECGTVTTYHHRHHIGSPSRQVTTYSDDPGYESDYKKNNQRYRYIDYSSSSSSSSDDDSDVSSSYLELMALNQAYNRAEKIQQHSRCISRYIVRQIKLAIATL